MKKHRVIAVRTRQSIFDKPEPWRAPTDEERRTFGDYWRNHEQPPTKKYLELENRIEQFRRLELPGQPKIMHVGTSNLVVDLWNTILELLRENRGTGASEEKP